MSGQRIRFSAEVASFMQDGDVDEWHPCTVEMGVSSDGPASVVYDVDVERLQPRASGDELSTMRDRVGRIARRLEDVTAELRMLAEGLSPEESARTLERIEESLGLGNKG